MNTTSRTSRSSRSILSVAASLFTRLLGNTATRDRAASHAGAPRLLLIPSAGRSSRPQLVPAQLAVAQGATLSLEFRWDEPHDVDWRGVRPLNRFGDVARAEIDLARLGSRRIEVTASSRDGRQVYAWTIEVEVLPRVAGEAA